MTRLSLLPLALLACADVDPASATFATEPVEDLGPAVRPGPLPPPLPQVMTLTSDAWVPGLTTLVTAEGAIPGAKVFFVRGRDLGSTCFAKLGGDCLDLDGPTVLGSAFADASGAAVFATPVDATLPLGSMVHLQAVVAAGAPYVSDAITMVAIPECGDGVVEYQETCDDGNTDDADGCSSTCQLEATDDLQIYVDAASIARKDPATGTKWDFDPIFHLFEDPDAYYTLWIDGVFVARSTDISEDRTPVWNGRHLLTLPDQAVLDVLVYDADSGVGGSDDYIGAVSFTGEELRDLADSGPAAFAGTWGLDSLEIEVRTP